MTTNTEASFLITACPAHGTKETGDRASFVSYVELALQTQHMHILGHQEILDPGVSSWVCCDQMVVDPFGELD